MKKNIKIKTQEFFDICFPGICFIVYGLLGYLALPRPVTSVVGLLSIAYIVYKIVVRIRGAEKLDDLAKTDIYKAAAKTFYLGTFIVLVWLGYNMFKKISSAEYTICVDLRIVSIALGVLFCFYYVMFRKQDVLGEDYDEN